MAVSGETATSGVHVMYVYITYACRCVCVCVFVNNLALYSIKAPQWKTFFFSLYATINALQLN